MADTLKVVRVFLASPGDLSEERRAAKAVVDELNNNWCRFHGYFVQLDGWEDTVAAYGRAQAVINKDVERCELFIGMLWKRWGTPPTKDGTYTSGFEEEFDISERRHVADGRPEISMFFKDVDADQRADPGPELLKVLAFKKKLGDDNVVLYQTFKDAEEFTRKVDRAISQFIQKLLDDERQSSADESRSLPEPSQGVGGKFAVAVAAQSITVSNPASVFLETIIKRGDTGLDDLSAIEIARFRLLAVSVTTGGNDERSLGIHDANLIFTYRQEISLTYREQGALIDTGCTHLKGFTPEITPLWHWYRQLKGFDDPRFSLYTVAGTEAKRVGAFAAMRLLREPLYTDTNIDRDFFLEEWFGNETPAPVKVAALEYLGECGEAEDLPPIRAELARAHYQTTSAAMDAILQIQLRINRSAAIRDLYEMQPASLRDGLAQELFGDGSGVSTEIVTPGLTHKSASVRRNALRILVERRQIPEQALAALFEDGDSQVRLEALRAAELLQGPVTLDRARSILVKPKSTGLAGLFSTPNFDREGEQCWEDYRAERVQSMTLSDLAKCAEAETAYDRTCWFAVTERALDEVSIAKVRAAVAEEYETEFGQQLKKLEERYGSGQFETIVQGFRSSADGVRRDYTGHGLDILCRRGDSADLELVRAILRKETVYYSSAQVNYLSKCGDWNDAELIVASLRRGKPTASILGGVNVDDGRYEIAADAIYLLGKANIEQILSLDAPTALRCRLVAQCTNSLFAKLSTQYLVGMLRLNSDSVRRAAALKCLRALPQARIEEIMAAYFSTDEKRFYNVVHWLDFGLSAPRPVMLDVVTRELARILD